MSKSAVLEIESLLEPIPGGNPSGESLYYEPEYDKLREARRSGDDAAQGDWQRDVKIADWDEVVEFGGKLLRTRTKDLQIAAWITEALMHRHGFVGLRDGFRLLTGLQDRFWETIHPEIEDGDLEPRMRGHLFLDDEKMIPFLIRSLPVTSGMGMLRYSWLEHKQSRENDNAVRAVPEDERGAAAERFKSEGKLLGAQFNNAVAQTSKAFYAALMQDLQDCREALAAFEASTDSHFGRDAPSLGNVRRALDAIRTLVEPFYKEKLKAEPNEQPKVEEEETSEDESREEYGGDDVEASDDSGYVDEEEERPQPRRAKAKARRSASGAIADADDARLRILEAAAYLRENEPSSPVAYLVVRAARMGELYGLSRPPDPASLEGPDKSTRQELKRLANEGEWSAALETAEQALGRPEGRAWLDAHRYAVQALASLDRSEAAEAAKRWLTMVLADFPGLPTSELNDDTPAANGETRSWLESEGILPRPDSDRSDSREEKEEEPVYEPPRREPVWSTANGSEAAPLPPDAWDEALELVQAGRSREALERIGRALGQAQTGREQFLRKLQMAELCLMIRRPQVAAPLLEDLARQVDEFRLEQWEDRSLCARVFGALYRCLKADGNHPTPPERLQQIYTRLCRLDIHLALAAGEG